MCDGLCAGEFALRMIPQPRVLSRSDQNLSCRERVQAQQNNTAEVPASSRDAVHHLRQHAYKQREPVSRVEIDGDEMMAAERRRVEEELPRQTHAA